MKTIRLATVFSGIGAVEQAMIKLNIPFEIVFACDTGERYIDINQNEILETIKNMDSRASQEYVKSIYNKTNKVNYVKKAYFANYDINEYKWHEDIRFIDGSLYKNGVDIFVGGSPCQSFSVIGKKAGLDDARGTLFYEYARLVKEIEPKVFIYENVPGMLSHDKGNTWNVIRDVFNSLDYKIFYKVLNAKNYGIPQDRKRLFIIGFKDNVEFNFPQEIELKTKLWDYLEKKVEPKHYLGKKGFEFVTNPKYKNRARLNHDIIQTQKANQQFNWNGDFIFEEYNPKIHNSEIMSRAYLGEWNGKIGVCRQLTYRECLRLMGFSDDFDIVVPNVHAYRQAGNSIVVNVLENIIKEIIKVVDFNE